MILWSLKTRWSWSADGDVELEISNDETNDDVRLPGHGISEDDQREIQAPHHVGSQGRPAALWRDQERSPARRRGNAGNRSPRSEPRTEGTRPYRADRSKGLRRRPAQGGVSLDPQGAKLHSRHRRYSQVGHSPSQSSRRW